MRHRCRCGIFRALLLAMLLGVAAASAQAPALSVPRHAEEARALTEPLDVLARLPARLAAAEARGDWREAALLRLAEANACRVLSRLACQRDAGRLAYEAGAKAGDRALQVRGLILQASGEIAMQHFVAAETLAGEAEQLLQAAPHPLLAADVYLAYSSISYALGKFDRARDYAVRGQRSIGTAQAPVIMVRLLRNEARALTQIGSLAPATAKLEQALALIPEPEDPKLRAELHVELAHVAHARGDPTAQTGHGQRALALAAQLDNAQLRGMAHEVLGIAALDRVDATAAAREFEQAFAAFRELELRRDERRVLRQLVRLQLDQLETAPAAHRAMGRLLELEIALESEDQARSADNFESRLQYAQQEFEVGLLKQSVDAAAQRQRLFYLLIALAIVLLATLSVGLGLQRRYSATVQQNQRRLQALTDNMPAAIAHIDRQERYLLANAHLAHMMRREAADLVGRSVREVRGEELYRRVKPHMDAALGGETVRFASTETGLGEAGHFNSVFVPDRAADGQVHGFYSLTFDVTDLTNAQAELSRLARIDSLTEIANRRHFEERLDSTLAHARRTGRGLAVLAMDLDHFKTINDTHGHQIGDAVLKEYARRVLACVRRDDFFARLGGDEFVLLVEEPPAIAGEVIARKLLQAMQPPFRVGDLVLPVSTSIGVAFGNGSNSPTELLAWADQALYAAKAAGRATFRVLGADAPPSASGAPTAGRDLPVA